MNLRTVNLARWWLLPRALMSRVFTAAWRQYAAEFEGVQMVYDGASLMYSPVLLPWAAQTEVFENVSPDSEKNDPCPQFLGRGGTFVVRVKLAEVVTVKSLADYYSSPDVNVRPHLRALGVILRCSADKRFGSEQRKFYSIDDEVLVPLRGGKEMRCGCYQGVRLSDHKVLLRLNKTTAQFYSPDDLLTLVLATLDVGSPSEISFLAIRGHQATSSFTKD